jgi:hypothetical protein
MNITLRYGHEGLPMHLSHDLDVQILHLHALPPLEDENAALKNSFRALLGGAPLEQIARSRKRLHRHLRRDASGSQRNHSGGLEKHGNNAKITVIPEGPYVTPVSSLPPAGA